MAKRAKDWFPDDQATHEWLGSLKKSTRATYQTNWKHFLEFTDMTGDQILADRKNDTEHRWERKVLAFKQWLIDKKGKAEYTATNAAMTVRGFFAYHYQDLKYRPTEAKRLKERTRKTEDYKFSREDLKKMSDVADLTEKYVIVGGKSFGLRAGDFLRLTRDDLEPYLDREPPISIGEYATEKEKIKAYPFIDADALPIIRLMIEQMNREGRISPDERILTYKHTLELTRVVHRVAVRAGIKFGGKRVRFHGLRKFLADHLSSHMSESKWKQVVGKAIDEKAYVSADELHKDYARAMVETCWTGIIPETDVERRVKLEILISKAKDLGLDEDEIRAKLSTMDLAELKEFEESLRGRSQRTEGDCQKIVPEEELGRYLAEGWKVQAVLPSGRIVVDNEH